MRLGRFYSIGFIQNYEFFREERKREEGKDAVFPCVLKVNFHEIVQKNMLSNLS